MLQNNRQIKDLVQDFYNQNPFPGFDPDKYVLREDLYGKANIFARMLDNQIPWGATILDAGCGTGQLACLLSLKNRKTVGVDFSERSILKANELKKKLQLANVNFRQDDLLNIKMDKEAFDYILCNGVLHHTADPYLGFQNLLTFAKKGTYIIIGLYNRYGRFWHRFKCRQARRKQGKENGSHQNAVRELLYDDDEDREKLETWYSDQYLHPHEHTHTIGELLGWYRKNDVEYVNSLPPIELFKKEKDSVRLFKDSTIKDWQKTQTSFFLKQLKWMVSLRKTWGYFLIVGRKR